MSIRARLRLALSVIAFLFLAGGLWVVDHTGRMDELTDEMSYRLFPAASALGAINTASSDLRIAELMHIGSSEQADKERFEGEMLRLRTRIDELRGAVGQAAAGAEAAEAALVTFDQLYQRYLSVSDEMLPLSRANRFAEAAALEMRSEQLFNEFSGHLDAMVAGALEMARANNGQAQMIYEQGRLLIISNLILVLAICGLILWAAERRVARPIAAVAGAARALAEGRLADASAKGLIGRRDEIGDLARAVEDGAAAVRGAVSALSVAAANAAAGDLSSRADPAALGGDYAQLAHAFNRLIEALSSPLREVAEVMRKVAAGDLEGRMTGVYEGDLRALKANLNRSLDTLVGLLGEMAAAADALAEGRLTARIEGVYRGSFADIKENVNDGLDSLRAAMAVIYVNIGQVAAAAVETAAAGNQVAALAADEAAARNAVRDVAGLAEQAHLASLNIGISAACGGAGFAQAAAEVADLAQRAADAARRLEGAGQRADGADSAAAAAQIGAAMNDLARMVDEIKCEIQRFKMN